MTKQRTIGWIGAGKMGLPICVRLREAGYDVVIYAHSERSRAAARENGFAHVGRLGELAAVAGVIAASIPDDAALAQIVGGEDGLAAGMAPGQILLELSTVSPEASARAASLLATAGAAYLRAPVSGSTAGAAAGTLTAIVSGPRAVYERLEPVFSAFTRKTFFVGESEEARYLKIAINGMVGATAALLAEALALSRKGGIDTATALEVIGESAVASPVIGYKRAMIVEERYEPNFTVEQMMKDFDILLSVARAVHAPLPLAAQIRQQYEAAWVAGHAQKDFFILVKQMQDAGDGA